MIEADGRKFDEKDDELMFYGNRVVEEAEVGLGWRFAGKEGRLVWMENPNPGEEIQKKDHQLLRKK